MQIQPIERGHDAFQRSVSATQIEAICRTALGSGVRVVGAVGLGLGLYISASSATRNRTRQGRRSQLPQVH